MKLGPLSYNTRVFRDGALILISAPIWVPACAMAMTFVGLVWLKRKAVGPSTQWARWLAWYPVNVGNSFDPDWRWLEMIDRRSFGIMCDNQYRTRTEDQHG